jgi:hypothetical protein
MATSSFWAPRTVLLTLPLGLAAGAGACSSSNGASSVGASQASTDLGTALCATIGSCSTFYVDVAYGDAGTCDSREATSLANVLAANGTGWTPATVESCARALSAAACADTLGHDPPAACQAPAGQLAVGMPCGDSSQCQSTYCNTGTGVCGTCAAARGTAGSPCYRDDDCAYGDVCNGAMTTPPAKAGACLQLAASGADCDDSHPCAKTLVCKSGQCAPPDEAGQACSTATCDSLAGLYCQTTGVKTTGTCAKVSLATPGAPCGLVAGQATECSGGGNCLVTTGTSGTCQAPIADGMPCDATKGPGCESPAVCTGGTCTIPNPTSCN